MGDRGNIAVIHDDKRTEQVWIYSHWGGTDMPTYLQRALQDGKDRWSDPSYLTRIIACRVIGKKGFADTTGIGISGTLQDNEHKILVVDCATQRVSLIDEGELNDRKVPEHFEPGKSWSFQEYADLKVLPDN